MLDSFNFLSFGNIKNGYSSENLISTRSSGQKEIFNLSKRMEGEEEKKEMKNINRIAYGSALVTRSNFYNRSHITLFASFWNFGKIIRQVLMRGIIARGPASTRGCDGGKKVRPDKMVPRLRVPGSSNFSTGSNFVSSRYRSTINKTLALQGTNPTFTPIIPPRYECMEDNSKFKQVV